MTHPTIKGAIKKALQDLSKAKFLEFCHQLRDRREKPRVSLSDVEDKSALEITDLLVSVFTEDKACEATVDLLRQINHNEEAKRLHSQTRARIDKGFPTFRKTSTGELETKPSQEAQTYNAGRRPLRDRARVKKPEEVESDAKALVISECGDPNDERVVLSRCVIQFGKYKGKTNKWLLENDLGYTAYLVASHKKEKQTKEGQNYFTANKDCLTRYVLAYPEVVQEVRFERAYNRSLESDQKGKVLVGFGRFRSVTLEDLYESEDKDKISCVDYLRRMKSSYIPGSRMETAIKYILQRDKRRPTGRKRAQSDRDQSTGASRPKKQDRKTPY